jgi:hypothetical protein
MLCRECLWNGSSFSVPGRGLPAANNADDERDLETAGPATVCKQSQGRVATLGQIGRHLSACRYRRRTPDSLPRRTRWSHGRSVDARTPEENWYVLIRTAPRSPLRRPNGFPTGSRCREERRSLFAGEAKRVSE